MYALFVTTVHKMEDNVTKQRTSLGNVIDIAVQSLILRFIVQSLILGFIVFASMIKSCQSTLEYMQQM